MANNDSNVESAQPVVNKGSLLVVSLLVVLNVSTALGVIYTTHQSRALFGELQQLRKQAWQQHQEWGRLVIERSTLAAHDQIQRKAASELSMVEPNFEQIRVVGNESQ